MAITPAQDAEVALRLLAAQVAKHGEEQMKLPLGEDLALAVEDHCIAVANILSDAANWICLEEMKRRRGAELDGVSDESR